MMDQDLMDFAIEDNKKNQIINTNTIIKKKNINKNLIKTMAVLKSKIKSSFFGNLKSYIISLYYYHNYSKQFEYKAKYSPIYLFNTEITSENKDQISNILNTFLYMSYRTNFTNLKTIDCGNYSTDCGWGCMIRCSQMMLSKVLIEKKYMSKNKKI